MEQMTVGDIIRAVEGQLLSQSDLSAPVTDVDTDSRKVRPGALFLPLVGERFDGHDYLDAALSAGAAGCLTQKMPETMLPGKFYIRVADTHKALGDLAAYYRARFAIPVIAVTGSVGKTTTKDMVAAALGAKYHVLKTEGNFNNDIGLPLTLLRLTGAHQAAVVEMGMNHLGEIDYLTRIARPDVALITNIGDAHIENLGSRENTLKAKSEIFHGMKPGTLVVLNGDDPLLRTLEGTIDQRILWCGTGENNDFRAEHLRAEEETGMAAEIIAPSARWPQEIPGLGSHMVYPVLMAAAVGLHLGLTPEEVRAGIAEYVPTKMRLAVLRRADNILLLDDTYNANPQSMRAAVEVLDLQKSSFKIAVLGDMLELGELGPGLHQCVGECVGRSGADVLITVGELGKEICRGARMAGMEHVYPCEDQEEAKARLRAELRPDCAVLCKASRGMHFEHLVEYLKQLAPEERV